MDEKFKMCIRDKSMNGKNGKIQANSIKMVNLWAATGKFMLKKIN